MLGPRRCRHDPRLAHLAARRLGLSHRRFRAFGRARVAWQLRLRHARAARRVPRRGPRARRRRVAPRRRRRARRPSRFDALDALTDAALSNHVANRASRAQGAALASTSAQAFPHESLGALRRRARADALPTHLAPAFGFVTRTLDVPRATACRLFVFVSLRTLVSSAVRLGCVGPLEAQSIQYTLGNVADGVAERHAARRRTSRRRARSSSCSSRITIACLPGCFRAERRSGAHGRLEHVRNNLRADRAHAHARRSGQHRSRSVGPLARAGASPPGLETRRTAFRGALPEEQPAPAVRVYASRCDVEVPNSRTARQATPSTRRRVGRPSRAVARNGTSALRPG